MAEQNKKAVRTTDILQFTAFSRRKDCAVLELLLLVMTFLIWGWMKQYDWVIGCLVATTFVFWIWGKEGVTVIAGLAALTTVWALFVAVVLTVFQRIMREIRILRGTSVRGIPDSPPLSWLEELRLEVSTSAHQIVKNDAPPSLVDDNSE